MATPGPATVEVLPDLTGLDRSFTYEVPDVLAPHVEVGSIVAVRLQGRRIRAWVTALSVPVPAGTELRPVDKVVSAGPSPDVVELCRFGAWRYAGRMRPFLVAASPPRVVSPLGHGSASGRPEATGGLAVTGHRGQPAPVDDHGRPGSSPRPRASGYAAALVADAFRRGSSVLRLPPAAPRLEVVEEAICHLEPDDDLIVLAATTADAATLAERLRRSGHRVASYPSQWGEAASGGRVVVGSRSAAFARVRHLGGVVVLDAHADSYKEERAPSYDAVVMVAERARRQGVPAIFVSACPTLELTEGRALIAPARHDEREGWSPLELLDARDEDPRDGRYPSRLASLLREAVAADPGRPAIAVLNRTGRARLLSCATCRGLLRCEVCGGALGQAASPPKGDVATLECWRCGWSGPPVCASCGPTRARVVRPGVARAREEVAALTGLEVAEVSASSLRRGEPLPGAPLLVGTEAVLWRATSASVVAFLDFDQELLAPRFRAGEQALALLALASRLAGGKRREGRVVVRSRLVDHPVLKAALHGDPSLLSDDEAPRRSLLRLPPASALASVSGGGAAAYVEDVVTAGASAGGERLGRLLVRASDSASLADAFAAAGRPPEGVRVEVDPRDV